MFKFINEIYSNILKFFNFDLSKKSEIQAKLSHIISSSEPEELKNIVVKEIALELGASGCFFLEYDLNKNNFNKIINAYTQTRMPQSFLGFDVAKNLNYFSLKLKYLNSLVITDTSDFINKNKLTNSNEEKFFNTFGIKALLAIRLEFEENFSGVLVLCYDTIQPKLNRVYQNELKDLASQISIALHLSKLYSEEKNKRESEQLLRTIISIISNDYDLEKICNKVFPNLGKMYDASTIVINIDAGLINKVFHYSFLVRQKLEFDENTKNEMFTMYSNQSFAEIGSKLNYIPSVHQFILQNNLERTAVEGYFDAHNVKSLLLFKISHENKNYGNVYIHFEKENPITADIVEMIRIVIAQFGNSVAQAKLYEKKVQIAQRETLLRSIIEKIRGSLDIEETLNFICVETAKLFNVQRSAITKLSNSNGDSQFEFKKEYLASPEIKSFLETQDSWQVGILWTKILSESNRPISFENIEESDAPDFFKETYKILGVKSIIGVPIVKDNKIWGNLVLSEYNGYRHWTDEEKELLIAIAAQVYIAINQAELYENQKLMVERERISKNIVEILRSSIDKKIIKKMFVKNIGKFFNADRVLFSEYDAIQGKYLPVDEDSEYLSNSAEISFVGYDWANSDTRDLIQPLLNKREVNIYNINEYLQNNNVGKEFVEFFKKSNINSSYNFPILYQQQVMGFFCIDYATEHRLSDEEIQRIRNMCSQAGIAVYHAKLYQEAMECKASKYTFVSEVAEKILKPASDIMDISNLLSKNEFTRADEILHLNKIINSCNQLLELTKAFAQEDED